MKYLKVVLNIFQWVLICFSVLAVIFALQIAMRYSFQINYEGFLIFINFFAPFSILFASTFVVVSAKYSIEQMVLMKESNFSFIANNERNQWISFITPHIDSLMETDFDLRIDLLKKLPAIHDWLFRRKYIISNKQELQEFFNTFFKYKAQTYEQLNTFWLNVKYYPDKDYSYSFQSFRQIFILMIDEKSYSNIEQDLWEIYMTEVRMFSKDLINQKEYAKAATEYTRKIETENLIRKVESSKF